MEFLYPEVDYTWNGKTPDKTAPANIKQAVIRLWKFIKDCTPTGVDPSSMSEVEVKQTFQSVKFRKEVAQYFDVATLTMWWVLTDYHMSVDQRVKNTFYRTWGDGIWWLTYYDGDTAFGKRNDAFLASSTISVEILGMLSAVSTLLRGIIADCGALYWQTSRRRSRRLLSS